LTERWWTQKRWQIGVMLLLVTAVGSIDRQAMSVTAGTIKAEYAISNTQYGALGFAFLLAYAVGQFFSGLLADRLGTRRALSIAVIAWSIAAMAHAFAQGFWGFFVARACLGLTEGPNLPTAFKAIAEWFPRAERSMATGLITAGTGLGLILAPPVAGLLTANVSWHAAFIVPGAAGLIWVWFWQRTYFLPEEHPRVSAAERELALSDRIGLARRGGSLRERLSIWAHYLQYRETWGLVLARFAGDGAFYFFAFWLPLYLQTQRGFSVLSVAFVAVLPFVFADIGSLSGGWAGQSLIRRGWSVDRSRKTLIWIGAIGSLVAWPVALVDSWVAALALASLAIFSIQIKSASLFPLAADIYPARDVATVWGMSGAAGSVGGALFQWGVGFMVDRYGYTVVFALASMMCVVQALLISLFIRRIEPLAETSAGGVAQ
jgi:ACS family hexuronate transporter-like MFS transporter